jgi:hypothetical protein
MRFRYVIMVQAMAHTFRSFTSLTLCLVAVLEVKERRGRSALLVVSCFSLHLSYHELCHIYS